MKMNEILSNLCWRDKRHPDFESFYGVFDEEPVPRVDCSCDNCFYRRDVLAVALLKEIKYGEVMNHFYEELAAENEKMNHLLE